MPPGLAITIVLIAACTLFALRPVRKPASISLLSYLMGMVFNEVPFAAFLYILLPVAAFTLPEDDVAQPVAWTSGAICLMLTTALVLIWWRQRNAVNEVQTALGAGLGHGWQPTNEATPNPMSGKAPGAFRVLVAPIPVGRFDVKRVANRSYGDAGRRNRLDVYHHSSRPAGAPVLLYFHGGHFRGGHKRLEARPLILRLASHGWVCVSASYRLGSRASFPDYVIDVKKVIKWVKENGPEFGAGPDSIFLAGSSAGGHMVSTAALTANDPSFQPGFEEIDTSVSGFISLYGYYGGLGGESGMPSSPVEYLSQSAPPAFLAHGDLDTLVRAEGARDFAESLRESSGSSVVYVELSGAQHGFDLLHSNRTERVVDGIEAWAAHVREVSLHNTWLPDTRSRLSESQQSGLR